MHAGTHSSKEGRRRKRLWGRGEGERKKNRREEVEKKKKKKSVGWHVVRPYFDDVVGRVRAVLVPERSDGWDDNAHAREQ